MPTTSPRVSASPGGSSRHDPRGGYGVSFTSGAYSNIARQLVGQPPFALTTPRWARAASAEPRRSARHRVSARDHQQLRRCSAITALGNRADVERGLLSRHPQVWNLGAGYTHTRGSSLDILRAPNRGRTACASKACSPSCGSRRKDPRFSTRRRSARGAGRSRESAPARPIRWRARATTPRHWAAAARSSRRTIAISRPSGSVELRSPASADGGPELEAAVRAEPPWLNNGGPWAALLENWRATATFTWQSGTPFTPRVTGAASDVARGTNARYAPTTPAADQVADPTSTCSSTPPPYTAPSPGTFGTASRNMIVGPAAGS